VTNLPSLEGLDINLAILKCQPVIAIKIRENS
jgi:hypothetical protein